MPVGSFGSAGPHRAGARGVGVHALGGMIVHERGLRGAGPPSAQPSAAPSPVLDPRAWICMHACHVRNGPASAPGP